MPLLVAEFVDQMADGSDDLHPPADFAASIRRRLARLDGHSVHGLRVAALVDRELDPVLLTRLGVKDVDRVIAAAVVAQLVVPATDGQRPRFVHELTRDAVAAEMTPEERVAVATDALQRLDLDTAGRSPDRIVIAAAHLAVAAGQETAAADLLIDLARRALSRGLGATALARLDEAERCSNHDPARWARLREHRLAALALVGRVDDANGVGAELLATAERTGDAILADRVQLALARAEATHARWRDVAARIDGHATDLTVAPATLVSLRAQAAMELGDPATADALARHVLGRAAADPVATCEAQQVVGRVSLATSYVRAAEHFAQAIRVATDAGLDLWRARAMMEYGACETVLESRTTRSEAAADAARRCGALTLAATIELMLAFSYVGVVRPREGMRWAQRCAEAASRTGSPLHVALSHVALGNAYAAAGDPARAALRLHQRTGIPEREVNISWSTAGADTCAPWP